MKQKTMELSITTRKIFLFGCSLFKSLFLAVTQVAWGLLGIFGLSLVLANLIKDGIPTEIDKGFMILELFIMEHIMFFVLIFFIIYYYLEIRELAK